MPDANLSPLHVVHTTRWRKVSNKFPLMVAKAYNGDVAAALLDDEVTVFARVEALEVLEGIEPRDWVAIGRKERKEREEE